MSRSRRAANFQMAAMDFDKRGRIEMIGTRFIRCLTVALMLLAGAWSFSAPAQVSSGTTGCLCPVRGLCCRCADGRQLQVDISTGVAPWRVRRGNAPSQPAIVHPIAAWTASLPPAQWITPPNAPEDGGDYVYELQYFVPECLIHSRFAVTGEWAVDNSGAISVDGGPPFATNAGFQTGNVASFTVPPAGLTLGLHTLTVVVNNISGPTGLLLRARITTFCPLQAEPASGELTEAPPQPEILPVEAPRPPR
jgi:hypothetical protein